MSDSPRWQVKIARQPEKVLRRLPQPLLQRLRVAIASLAENPRPRGCKKLAGYDDLYRIRVGDWRIIYAIEDEQLVILAVRVAKRGGAYW